MTRYPVGTQVMVEMEVIEVDESSVPYRLQSIVVGEEEHVVVDVWVSEVVFQKLIEVQNPDLKRKRIQEQIDKLQKELEGIN